MTIDRHRMIRVRRRSLDAIADRRTMRVWWVSIGESLAIALNDLHTYTFRGCREREREEEESSVNYNDVP